MIDYKGRIFILVDKDVYSSSEAFTNFSKETNFATIVGTATGGDGIGFAPVYFSLPNSGLVLRMASCMGLNPDGSSNEEFGTIPDIIINPGEDALEKVLEMIKVEG